MKKTEDKNNKDNKAGIVASGAGGIVDSAGVVDSGRRGFMGGAAKAGFAFPLHPGARKYYKEQGWL